MNKFKLIALLLCSSCFNSGTISLPIRSDLDFKQDLDVLGYLGYSFSASGEGERDSFDLRLEQRNGLTSQGIEIRNSDYSFELEFQGQMYPNEADGIEIGIPFRSYFTEFGDSAYIEANPIFGLGLENTYGVETDPYILLSLGIGYRGALAESSFFEIGLNLISTLQAAEMSQYDPISGLTVVSEFELDGTELIIGFGNYF